MSSDLPESRSLVRTVDLSCAVLSGPEPVRHGSNLSGKDRRVGWRSASVTSSIQTDPFVFPQLRLALRIAPYEPLAWKGYRAGTHRLVAPPETLESGRRFLVMGTTPVADVTRPDS